MARRSVPTVARCCSGSWTRPRDCTILPAVLSEIREPSTTVCISVVGLLRQPVSGRLAGYDDVNDADHPALDPARLRRRRSRICQCAVSRHDAGSLRAAGGQIDRQSARTAPAPAVPAPVVMFAPQPQPQPANEILSRLIALTPDVGAANQQSPLGRSPKRAIGGDSTGGARHHFCQYARRSGQW